MKVGYVKSTLLTVLFGFWGCLWAQQKHESQWVFGFHAGLDFRSGTPVPFQSAIEGFGEGNASVCDVNGNLLFYTEGSFIWDRTHKRMPNGSELTGVTSTTGYSVTSSASQGTLIIPMPGDTTKYYVFSLTSMEQNGVGMAGRLYYSIVDMTLNGGLGDVVPGQKGIFIDSALSERMTAVVGDRCNIWVLCCSVDAKIKAYEIDFSVVKKEPVVSNVGIRQEFTGCLAVSPDGKKLAATKCYVFGGGNDGTMLFDFDITTGLASNPISLLPGFGGYGVAFSPDNSKLYATAGFQYLYQWDLTSNNPAVIKASEIRIGDATMSGMRLGPDGKIYLKSQDNALGTINAPNLPGLACNYTPNIIKLASGTHIHSGLPNQVPEFSFSKDTLSTFSKVTDACFENSVMLSASDSDGWTYRWSDGAEGKDHVVKESGIYWVSYYTSPCSYNVDSFEVSLPSVFIANSCQSGASGFAAVSKAPGDTLAYTFTWRDASGKVVGTGDTLSGVPPGTYILEVVSEKSCSSKHEIVIGTDIYNVSFEADTLVCIRQDISFANTSDPYYVNQTWYWGDGTTDVNRNPSHNYVNAGVYDVVLVAYGTRCADTFSRSITVDDIVNVTLTSDRDTVCTGTSIRFSSQPGNNATLSAYKWSLGDNVTFSGTGQQIEHAYEMPGLKHITLTANFRICPEQDLAKMVYVASAPLVNLGSDSGICLNGEFIMLSNLHDGQPGVAYEWNTGATTPEIKVYDAGTYKLTLTSKEGCSTFESITVRKNCYIDIPNVFSPNDDGYNDYFFPRQLFSSSVTGFRMQIFNRWGQKLFETSAADGRGWDGRFNGKDQPQGAYIYVIEVDMNGQRRERYTGNLTIVR